MRSLILLYSVYLCIYSTFLYIYYIINASNITHLNLNSNSTFFPNSNLNTIWILVGMECFVLLLGGLLAVFVVPAYVLLILTIVSFVFGVGLLEVFHNNFYCCWAAVVLIGISSGLFKFIFLVMTLDQKSKFHIKMKIAAWLSVENLCYVIVYTLIPSRPDPVFIRVFGILVIVISTGLLITGRILKIYGIDSDRINLLYVIQTIKKPKDIFQSLDKEYKESHKILVSISKSTIILFLLLPYGICDSQERYVYEYQSYQLRQPNFTYFAMKSNFWPTIISSLTVIISFLIMLGLRNLNVRFLNRLYSNIKLKIIVGNILMISSTLIGGIVETIRYKQHADDRNSSSSIIQKIGHVHHEAADMSVFFMVPQIILLGLSEVLVIPSCVEFIYRESVRSTKYLAIAFVISVIGFGGLSEVLSVSIIKGFTFIYDENMPRLDITLYGLSGLAFIALLVSIYLMEKFNRYFKPVRCESSNVLSVELSEHKVSFIK